MSLILALTNSSEALELGDKDSLFSCRLRSSNGTKMSQKFRLKKLKNSDYMQAASSHR